MQIRRRRAENKGDFRQRLPPPHVRAPKTATFLFAEVKFSGCRCIAVVASTRVERFCFHCGRSTQPPPKTPPRPPSQQIKHSGVRPSPRARLRHHAVSSSGVPAESSRTSSWEVRAPERSGAPPSPPTRHPPGVSPLTANKRSGPRLPTAGLPVISLGKWLCFPSAGREEERAEKIGLNEEERRNASITEEGVRRPCCLFHLSA